MVLCHNDTLPPPREGTKKVWFFSWYIFVEALLAFSLSISCACVCLRVLVFTARTSAQGPCYYVVFDRIEIINGVHIRRRKIATSYK